MVDLAIVDDSPPEAREGPSAIRRHAPHHIAAGGNNPRADALLRKNWAYGRAMNGKRGLKDAI